MTEVSFIILNYNSATETINCVNSIFKHYPKTDYEIIIVDNCSKEEDFQLLKKLFNNKCTIIKNKLNFGFGGGNMIGANFANGKYLCFLNSDIKLKEDHPRTIPLQNLLLCKIPSLHINVVF